jgi:hypothetical protein
MRRKFIGSGRGEGNRQVCIEGVQDVPKHYEYDKRVAQNRFRCNEKTIGYLHASTNNSRMPLRKPPKSLDSFSLSTTLSISSRSTFGLASSTL